MLASIIKVNGFSPFRTLMLREYWENRRAIFMTPLVISGIFILFVIISMGIFGKAIHIDGDSFTIWQAISNMSAQDADEVRSKINHLLLATNVPVIIGAWFCMVFTALGSLYDEKKDNSILFWKSMPVSDLQTVFSKLLTVMLVIPLVALCFSFILQLFILIVGSVATFGTEHSAWNMLWSNTNFPALILTEISAVLMYALWSLPIFAWFMLVSVVAKRTPLLLATIPVVLTSVLEELFFNTSYLAMFFAKHLSINLDENPRFGDEITELSAKTSLDIMSSITDPELWLGLAIAAGLLYATILLRKRSSL